MDGCHCIDTRVCWTSLEKYGVTFKKTYRWKRWALRGTDGVCCWRERSTRTSFFNLIELTFFITTSLRRVLLACLSKDSLLPGICFRWLWCVYWLFWWSQTCLSVKCGHVNGAVIPNSPLAVSSYLSSSRLW